jgi:squalene synthase HpnC
VLFHDLLSAFRQDVTQKRYRDFDEVLDYCRRSANPVGRLLLHLHNEASEENLQLSDNICSALQLINFLQDLEQDYRENNRIYLPQDDMARYGVTENDIAEQHASLALQHLLAHQRERVTNMMRQGALLGTRLHGRFGLEIRLIIEGGLAVLEKLSAQGNEVFSRPRLKKTDYLRIVGRALYKRRHLNARAAPSSP